MKTNKYIQPTKKKKKKSVYVFKRDDANFESTNNTMIAL